MTQVVVITGASSGFGRLSDAMATAFATRCCTGSAFPTCCNRATMAEAREKGLRR